MNRKRRAQLVLRVILLIGTPVSLYFVPWGILLTWLRPLPSTVEEQVELTQKYGFEGVILYVDMAGLEPEFYAAGWHDRDRKIPADPHALFKIASIAKLYDAVAITKLVADGQLSLDQTLADTFPELVGRIEHADAITLRHMVQHRSGIPNYTDTPGFWSAPPDTEQAVLELALDQPALFKPGEGYAYSNTNYLLINRLIERTVEISKFSFIEERILKRLGLNRTFSSMHDERVNMDDLMSGYYVGLDHDLKTNDLACMVATAEDVGVFLRALNDGSLFDEGEKAIYDSIYVYEHTGLIPGYQSIAKYHPDMDTVVVQFTNTTEFGGDTWSQSEIGYNRVVKILGQR